MVQCVRNSSCAPSSACSSIIILLLGYLTAYSRIPIYIQYTPGHEWTSGKLKARRFRYNMIGCVFFCSKVLFYKNLHLHKKSKCTAPRDVFKLCFYFFFIALRSVSYRMDWLRSFRIFDPTRHICKLIRRKNQDSANMANVTVKENGCNVFNLGWFDYEEEEKKETKKTFINLNFHLNENEKTATQTTL